VTGPADPPPTLPAERTALAWTRTALAYGAVVLLGTRLATDPARLAVAVVAGGAAGAVALATVGAVRHRRAEAALATARPVAAPAATATAAALAVLLGLAAAALVLTH
jgi:uncharacterized membrane protein YidH (DUF202 family)